MHSGAKGHGRADSEQLVTRTVHDRNVVRYSTSTTIIAIGAPDAKYEDVYKDLTGLDVSNVEDIKDKNGRHGYGETALNSKSTPHLVSRCPQAGVQRSKSETAKHLTGLTGVTQVCVSASRAKVRYSH